jgi:hypothetical protein
MWGRPLAWSTARIWALQAGGPDEPGVIWCGTCRAACFAPPIRGESWEMVRSLWDHPKRKQWMGGGADLPGIHSILVDPHVSKRCVDRRFDRRHLVHRGFRCELDATRRGHARRVRATGVHPRPHRLDVLPGAMPRRPHRMWVQHHNGISVSSDEGKTFSEITSVEPSTFGFPVVVHPREPDTAWFVPEIKDEKRIPATAGWSSRARATAARASTS